MGYLMLLSLEQVLMGRTCITTWPMVGDSLPTDFSNQISDGLDWFEDVFMPLINAIQSDEITNATIRGSIVGVPALSQSRTVSGNGLVASDGASTLPPQIAIYFRQSVGETIVTQTNAPYGGNRPIRRGGVFMPGLTEDWVNVSGAVAAPGMTVVYHGIRDAYIEGFTSLPNNVTYVGAVWSYPREALPPSPSYPDGKPARPFVHAKVTGMEVADVTRLRSRKS